jgi:hypothetical protein
MCASNEQARHLKDRKAMTRPVLGEFVTLTCGCRGIISWSQPGVAACGVVITGSSSGCAEHETGHRKLVLVATISERRGAPRRSARRTRAAANQR